MARKRTKRAAKSDKRPRKPQAIEHEDDVFAQILEPKTLRKSMLQGAKFSLESLLQYHQILHVRKKKNEQLAVLKKELDSMRLLARKLSELMPIAKEEEMRVIAGLESKKNTKEMLVEDTSGEFAGIEKALRAIQSRLQHL